MPTLLVLLGLSLTMVALMGCANGAARPGNSVMVIAPYRYSGTWVFDDPNVGLVREPFVSGVPEMIDEMVKDIPRAREDGFRLTFSAGPFPGHEWEFKWVRAESGGNVYRMEVPPMEGWLCPALFQYFEKAPQRLYVRADPISR
jgi:hypothetical protein